MLLTDLKAMQTSIARLLNQLLQCCMSRPVTGWWVLAEVGLPASLKNASSCSRCFSAPCRSTPWLWCPESWEVRSAQASWACQAGLRPLPARGLLSFAAPCLDLFCWDGAILAGLKGFQMCRLA